MFLKKFIFINWGNVPPQEFEFGPINLFSGGNGSGKTTAADAIQTIMTAAHDTLFQFNPGQEEATQRGRGKQVRTLASYVLGCDDGSYARLEPSVGYLAAVFHPTEGEGGEPFTAVIGLSARIDRNGNQQTARLHDQQYWIVPGHTLALKDFLQAGKGDSAEEIIPLKALAKQFQKNLGHNIAEKYDTKKQYLRRLYAALRGRDDAVSEREALNAARAFSRFMAYKPVRSIHDFVAGEILEPRDLGEAIRSVSDLMKTIHAMEGEAKRLQGGIQRLRHGQTLADGYVQQWIERHVIAYTLAQARYQRDQQSYLTAKQAQTDLRDQLDERTRSRELAESQRQQVRQDQVRLEAKRMGIHELKDKAELDRQHGLASEQLQQQTQTLLTTDQTRVRLEQALQMISDRWTDAEALLVEDDTDARRLHQAVDELPDAREALSGLGDELGRLLNRDWVDLEAMENSVQQTLALENRVNQWVRHWQEPGRYVPELSLRDWLARVLDRRQQKAQQLDRQISQQQQEVQALAQSQVSYPAFVRNALAAIAEAFPESDPQVLCEHVTVAEPEWQNAIEAYMGMTRFGIIVAPEYEADAARLVRRLPGADSRARVIQGARAREDAERQSLKSSSIAQVLKFSHATAEAYVKASFGAVERVDSVDELRRTRRGVCLEGVGSGGYALFRCELNESDLVFGQGARERAATARQAALQEQRQLLVQQEQACQTLSQLYQAVDSLASLQVTEPYQALLQAQRTLQEAERALADLDIEQYRSLDEEYERLKDKATELDNQIRQLDAELGRIEEQLTQCDELCQRLSDAQEKTQAAVEDHENRLEDLTHIWPEFNLDERLSMADEEARDADPDALEQRHASGLNDLNRLAHDLEQTVLEHNQHSQPGDAMVFAADFGDAHSLDFFSQIAGLSHEIGRIHNRLKNNVLVEKTEQLGRLRDSFNDTFVTNLCHAIYHAINDGKRVLEELNQELAHHRFGADRERYWFDWAWVPEFQEYWHFFEEVTRAPGLGEKQTLFTLELSARSARVRDRILSMLLDEDEQKAMRELERISDYRNYRSYEIYKQPDGKEPIALSQYGTGSGGQLETPAYIIRSAAITSAFHFNEGDTHLRMVLVDEAFSKMDEARSREVIQYLTESLGLQLLFIMPTSKSGPFMDLISNQFVFSKIPLGNGQRIGELNSRVLVDRQACNQEQIQALWANHRRIIRHQAELDFMDAFA
ncbi:hypothetical protein E4656_02380 [Natronospirillum operosum]|uniref:AAA family ATPase n=1 Tax=Natronospirillum operosum TaxID=2759953 RepID=A0A4Z0WF80_9GAMM|nr:SbcC/MukB-like Walker B domain-containing protein [Natronospirillum operosum]TGG95288.1 hypothetical protein E4656_02380 [Natronospirillum operosum]